MESDTPMITQQSIDTVIDDMVRRIAERFRPEKIILFGSYARGQATEDSDIDLLVVMPVEHSTRQKANEIDLALADRTVPLDVIVVTPEQFERERDVIGTVLYKAVREGKILYKQ